MNQTQAVKDAQMGNTDSFRVLVKKHTKWLLGLLSTLTSRTEAEDIGQEVWVIAWSKLKTLKDPARFKPWLRTIAVREAVKTRRKLTAILTVDDISVEDLKDSFRQEKSYSERDFVLFLLKDLSPEQKATLILSEIEGMTEKEISEVLSIPVGTVKSRLNTIKKKLRKIDLMLNEDFPKEVENV
ncbi:RNA polymerase sigma factor [bacterium]|nr:RNA polymerase sigma factor [bacterium]